MKIVFFGTPSFAANILTDLIKHHYEIVAVVTKKDKPKGRSGTPQPSSVKIVAQTLLPHIPLFQPDKVSAADFVPILQNLKADLFVVVGYGEILKQNVLDTPSLGCINVHASLLPKYRGAAPIQRSLMQGEKETGITIMHMALKLDAGAIIRMAKMQIPENMQAGELAQQLSDLAKEPLRTVLDDFVKGKVSECPQNEAEVTFAPKVELQDAEILWERSAEEIHNLIRGVTPNPGAWCWANIRGERKRLKILCSQLAKELSGTPRAILSYGKEGIVVGCAQEAIKILELQVEGKKAMSASSFVLGLGKQDLQFI